MHPLGGFVFMWERNRKYVGLVVRARTAEPPDKPFLIFLCVGKDGVFVYQGLELNMFSSIDEVYENVGKVFDISVNSDGVITRSISDVSKEQFIKDVLRSSRSWVYEKKKLEAALVGFIDNNAVLKQSGNKFVSYPVRKFSSGNIKKMELFSEVFPERNFQPQGKKTFTAKENADAMEKIKKIDAADNSEPR